MKYIQTQKQRSKQAMGFAAAEVCLLCHMAPYEVLHLYRNVGATKFITLCLFYNPPLFVTDCHTLYRFCIKTKLQQYMRLLRKKRIRNVHILKRGVRLDNPMHLYKLSLSPFKSQWSQYVPHAFRFKRNLLIFLTRYMYIICVLRMILGIKNNHFPKQN
jgi:hypothetical protein